MESLHVLVFGAGAIGTYIGGSLAGSGHRVTFIEQPGVARALQESGLKLDFKNARGRDPKVVPDSLAIPSTDFKVSGSLAEALAGDPFDFAIFALKSFDTPSALAGMQPHVNKMPPVLCLQNGVENEPALSAVLGAERVIAGTVTSAVGRLTAGDIVLERLRGVGIAAGHPLSPRLVEAFDHAGLNARSYSNPAGMKWSKMLTNLVANATSAILDMTPAEVFAHTGLFQLEMRMLRETLTVMKALSIPVVDTPKTPVRLLALATRLPGTIARRLMTKSVGGGRGGKMPSFHIDLHGGRGRSEVDSLNGAVVRYGGTAHVPTPVNRLLNETLLALTHGEIPLQEFQRQPQKLLALVPGDQGK